FIENISKFTYIFNPSQWRTLAGKRDRSPLNLSVPPSYFGLICNAKMWHETLLSSFFYYEESLHRDYRKFYSIVFKICRSLAYISRPLNSLKIFDPDHYSFIPEINDHVLQEWCEKTRYPKSRKDFEKKFHKRLVEIASRSLLLLDEAARKHMEARNRKTFPHRIDRISEERRPLPQHPLLSDLNKKTVNHLSEIRNGLSSLIFHQSKYHLILSPGLLVNDISEILTILHEKSTEWGIKQNLKVSTPYLFYFQITSDPFEYSTFSNSSQIIFDDNPQLTENLLSDWGQEKIYINLAYLILAKNSTLLLREDECRNKLAYILTRLLAQRIFLERDILVPEGEELDKYAECFSAEPETQRLFDTLTQTGPALKISNQKTKSIISNLYCHIDNVAHLIRLSG
ncbi:MAG: hypothetical protein ACOY3D_04605, partial [Candidatus Omnitrophota bacterium]